MKIKSVNNFYSIVAIVKEIKNYLSRDDNNGKLLRIKLLDESKEKFELVTIKKLIHLFCFKISKAYDNFIINEPIILNDVLLIENTNKNILKFVEKSCFIKNEFFKEEIENLIRWDVFLNLRQENGNEEKNYLKIKNVSDLPFYQSDLKKIFIFENVSLIYYKVNFKENLYHLCAVCNRHCEEISGVWWCYVCKRLIEKVIFHFNFLTTSFLF